MADSATAVGPAQVHASLVANSAVCRAHVRIELVAPAFPASEPGQFVQLHCGRDVPASARSLEWPPNGFPALGGEEWRGSQAFLRRPFSVADRWTAPDGQAHLVIISRTVGPGTQWLEELQPGGTLGLLGPLGRGFELPRTPLPIVLLGGGVGIPPLLYLARRLHELKWPDVTVILGATTGALFPVALRGAPASDGTPRVCVELPAGAEFPAIVTSDDGSLGLSGVVTDGLSRWQQRRPAGARPALVCACGPEPMLQAAARLTRQFGLDCQLCIERRMGCGLGTCLSCVVRRRDPQAADGWSWALTCTDGPVFQRDELLDYAGPVGA